MIRFFFFICLLYNFLTVHFFGVPLLSFFLRSVHILGFFASSNICFLKIKNKMKTRLHSKFIFFFVFTSFIFLSFKFDHWFFYCYLFCFGSYFRFFYNFIFHGFYLYIIFGLHIFYRYLLCFCIFLKLIFFS